jgi:hypothetical protein
MYGLAMMVFAFIVGLTGILTGLEVPVLQVAAQAVRVGPGLVDCEKIAYILHYTYVYMMVDNARNHSMLYGTTSILDCLEQCMPYGQRTN